MIDKIPNWGRWYVEETKYPGRPPTYKVRTEGYSSMFGLSYPELQEAIEVCDRMNEPPLVPTITKVYP